MIAIIIADVLFTRCKKQINCVLSKHIALSTNNIVNNTLDLKLAVEPDGNIARIKNI